MDLVIRNATVVTAADVYEADVGIAGGTIAQIGRGLTAPRTIDAVGKYLFPGGIDVHTHLDSPSQGIPTADDFRSGTIAAACGGTTAIIDFCAQLQGQGLIEALEIHHAKAAGKAAIDYGFTRSSPTSTRGRYRSWRCCRSAA